MREASPGGRPRRPYHRPRVTSERVEETVLSTRCKKLPSTPGATCQLAKKFYG